jgi:hypothetical protein
MIVVVMFVGAIFVLRKLDLTRGKMDAEEVGPIAATTLGEEEPDDAVEGIVAVPEALRTKEDPE